MIGIVLVSHSRKLAEGVKELAAQMTQGKVLIEAAGGIDDEENPIGTDAMRVMAAIEQVYQDDDVLVLMDMGSALMSAEMAIQFLPEEMQAKVHLCSAPIVEGGVAAAVQAMLGSGIAEVKSEALQALDSKKQQLHLEDGSKTSTAPLTQIVQDTVETSEFDIVVPNKNGLHARPAAKLIQLTEGLDVFFQIAKDKKAHWVNGKSLNKLSLLGAKKGETLFLSLSGVDAPKLKERILAFTKDNFGDDDIEIKKQKTTESDAVKKDGIYGIPSSSGIAIGKAFRLHRRQIQIPKIITNNVEKELNDWQQALQAAKLEVEKNKQHALSSLDKKEAEIFDAHLLFLEDIDLLKEVEATINQTKKSAAQAWFDITEKMTTAYLNSENSYIKERATDVKDIQAMLLKHLGIKTSIETNFKEPVILLAQNLQPSETLKLDTDYVKGFVLQEGNENAHTAILARSLGIPCITGLAKDFEQIPEQEQILIDGDSGEILTATHSESWKQKLKEKEKQEKIAVTLKQKAEQKVCSKNGVAIKVKANISGITDAKLASQNGADGVGLFRTELYFMNQTELPSEQQQYELYCEVSELLQGKPITIRTLDVGGDKPIHYLPIDEEENPFLGLRGIRFTLAQESVFKVQLRAILRASATYNVRIMFPMISQMNEWKQAKALLEECKQELSSEGIPYNTAIPCGMMVEVPSVVIQAEDFAKEVDFFSIGTNDLSQYMMAVDRGNPRVKYLITDLEPAVLAAIKAVGIAAQKYKKPVAVCGELGAKEEVIPFLLQYGVRSLSMNALQIPKVKNLIPTLSIK